MTKRKWTTYQERMQVTVPEGEYEGLKVERFEVEGNELWNLRAALRHGRGCEPGTYTRLLDYSDVQADGGPQIWMSDTTAERDDHAFALAAVQMLQARTVLINGLGLGMVLQGALTYDHVRKVQVVEKDKRVIELIGPHYLLDPRVEIIHADAYEQLEVWKRGSRWDVVWSDIWPEIDSANLPFMDRLHHYYRPRAQFHGMWARKECLALRRKQRALGL